MANDNRSIARALWTIAIAIAVFVLFVISCVSVRGQEIEVKIISPLQAAFDALSDAASLPPKQRKFTRYAYCLNGTPEEHAAAGFIAHAAIYNTAGYVPVAVVTPHIVRFDFLLGEADPLIWEKLWPDPFFNVVDGGFVEKKITVEPYVASDGQTYNFKYEKRRLIFHEAALPHAQALSDLLGTNVPIVDLRFLAVRALSTVNYGLGSGLYNEFVGIKKAPEGSNLTDLEFFFSQFQIDLKAARAKRQIARAVVLNSGVTKKPRAIEVAQGAAHPGTSDGVVYATYDLSDEDDSVDRDPLDNLIDFIDKNRFRAAEVIAPRVNGMHIGALFNGKGELQNSVPDNVAIWGDVPGQYTKRLVPFIACAQCHGTKAELGLKTFHNDAADLPALFDLSADRDRLRSEYTVGNPIRMLTNSRNYYADAFFRATGGKTVDYGSDATFALFTDLVFSPVDAAKACREIGEKVANSEAARLKLAEVPTANPWLQALVGGKEIPRTRWARILPDAARHFRKDVPAK